MPAPAYSVARSPTSSAHRSAVERLEAVDRRERRTPRHARNSRCGMERQDEVEGGRRGVAEEAVEPGREVPHVRRLAQNRFRVPRQSLAQCAEGLGHRVDDDLVLLPLFRRGRQRLGVRSVLLGVARSWGGTRERIRSHVATSPGHEELRRGPDDHAGVA